ncbi:hypothetical protein Hanom_Chr01g00036321 [Helianthus anomalus]
MRDALCVLRDTLCVPALKSTLLCTLYCVPNEVTCILIPCFHHSYQNHSRLLPYASMCFPFLK